MLNQFFVFIICSCLGCLAFKPFGGVGFILLMSWVLSALLVNFINGSKGIGRQNVGYYMEVFIVSAFWRDKLLVRSLLFRKLAGFGIWIAIQFSESANFVFLSSGLL